MRLPTTPSLATRFHRIAAVALLATSTQMSAQTLSATYELRDGEVYDIAAQANATVSPDQKRMWVAQGRVRAAIRLSDGARMRSENRFYNTTGVASAERPVAVEVDDAHNLLYTLTAEGTLVRESITNPSNPVAVGQPFNLIPKLLSGEEPIDMKLWTASGEEVVVVLTNHRVLTIVDSSGSLVCNGVSEFVSKTSLMSDSNPTPSDSIKPLQVGLFDSLSVGKDADNRVVAYVQAFMQGYEVGPNARPFPRCVVLCDLDLAGGYAAPKFEQTSGSGFTYHRFYNPMPCAPVGQPPPSWPACAPGTSKYDYAVRDTHFLNAGAFKYLYVACGRRNQVRRLDVSHAFTTGITVETPIAIDPTFTTNPGAAHDIEHVTTDPTNGNRVIAIEQNGGIRVVDTSTATNSTIANNLYASGGLRDLAVVALAGKPVTVWTMDNGRCDFVFKTVNASTATLTLDRTAFWTYRSDGAVALTPDAIYMLTFGGVVRCTNPGGAGNWLPDPATYQPAKTPNPAFPGSFVESTTEHIDIGKDVTATGDHRLFTADGKGGFNEFRISTVTQNPMPATLISNPDYANNANLFPGWLATDRYYANDVAYVKIDEVPYVLTDVMNQTSQKAYLIAWRFDTTLNTWKLTDAKSWATGAPSNVTTNTDTIHVTNDLVKPFAFVSTNVGFFSVGLSTLPATGTMYSGGTAPLPSGMAACKGVATSKSRAFAFYTFSGTQGTTGRVTVFKFDTSTGLIATATPVQSIDSSSLTMPLHHTFTRVFRARFNTVNATTGCGGLYACGDGGTLIEFSYNPSLLTNPLAYTASWKSDYNLPIQDCRLYDFGAGLKLLTAKDSEGLALVTPSIFTCP